MSDDFGHEDCEVCNEARRAERDALAARVETAESLLRECEMVMFEGVREDALNVTGCESWDEVREDSDEVRWRVQQFLGEKVVNRERFKRIGRAEAAEARVETLENVTEFMWTVVCNVSEGDWDRQRPEWQEAAARVRDQWHAYLASRPAGEETQG